MSIHNLYTNTGQANIFVGPNSQNVKRAGMRGRVQSSIHSSGELIKVHYVEQQPAMTRWAL